MFQIEFEKKKKHDEFLKMQQLREFEQKKEAERKKKQDELRKSQELQKTLSNDDDSDKEFIAKEDDAEWRQWDETRCEIVLEANPFDNAGRFRLSQILIQEDKELETAKRLITSIQNTSPKFLKAECLELLGDIEASDQNKNYE